MAGHMASIYLKETGKYDIATVCHSLMPDAGSYKLDVYDTASLEQIIRKKNPDVVINCIGVLIKGSKSNPANAIYVNAYFPHKLSEILHAQNPDGKVIHISTDCVFSGNEGGYKDSDCKNALDTYGMTKNLGELLNGRDLTLRTSIIGPELKKQGEGLMHWVFGQQAAGELNGWRKSLWGGITTLELAKVLDAVIASDLTGLYQVSNNEAVSKYDLVSMIVSEFGLPIKVNAVDGTVCDKSIFNSVRDGFSYRVPGYHEMISQLHAFMKSHQSLYTQYLGE
ncbi:MAG: sugar nucleotide-binding protein [Paludibacteraceae bacterium]|nr:sugar nucleotide-binding protein [Paludibacteraceae bacterium]